jgi:hypothetical protein
MEKGTNKTNAHGIPHRDTLLLAIYEVLRNAQGPLHNTDIENEVGELLNLTKPQRELRHDKSYTKLGYELAWARSKAKAKGHLISPKAGFWTIAPSSPYIHAPKA